MKEKIKTPEEQVLIMACLNPTVAKAATDSANAEGVKVVLLEEKIIHDFLAENCEEGGKTMDDFLNNASNRIQAEQQATQMFQILIGIKGDIEDEKLLNKYFTRTNITNATNLSHSQAQQLLQVFQVFGLVSYHEEDKKLFKFNMSVDMQVKAITKEVVGMGELLQQDLMRLRNTINGCEAFDDQQKIDTWSNTIAELKTMTDIQL